jgi:hypothetical protein
MKISFEIDTDNPKSAHPDRDGNIAFLESMPRESYAAASVGSLTVLAAALPADQFGIFVKLAEFFHRNSISPQELKKID